MQELTALNFWMTLTMILNIFIHWLVYKDTKIDVLTLYCKQASHSECYKYASHPDTGNLNQSVKNKCVLYVTGCRCRNLLGPG